MIKKNIFSLFLVSICFVKLLAQSSNDTLAIRKTLDSIIDAKEKKGNTIDENIIIKKLVVFQNYNVSKLQFLCYKLIANQKTKKGDNELAKLYIDTSYAIAKKINCQSCEADMQYIEGIYLKYNGKSDLAMKKWFESLAYYKSVGNEKRELAVLSAIAREYLDLKQFDKAKEYLLDIIERKIILKDESGLSQSYNTLANVYVDTKNYNEGLTYYNKALSIGTKRRDTLGLAYTYNNLARSYSKQKNFKDANKYWQSSYDLFNKTTDAYGIAMITNNMAYINGELGNQDKAIEFAKKAVVYSTEHDIQVELMRAHGNLFDAYFEKKDYDNAYAEHEAMIKLKEEQFSKDIASATAEAEQKYNAKIQKDSIALLNYDKKVNTLLLQEQNEKITQRNYLILLITMITILIGTVSYLLFMRLKNKKNKQLQEQENEASLKIIQSEQTERMRIARELHDGIGQKLTVLKMYASVNETENNTSTGGTVSSSNRSVTKQIELLDSTINEVRGISHNLMPEIINLGLVPAVKDLCAKINEVGTINCVFNYDETQPLKFATNIELSIYRIVQEVLNNMIKHANAKQITVSFSVINTNLKISIADDGVGFDTKKIYTSSGIGWSNIITRARIINANLDVNSNNKGTNIVLNINI